MDLTHILTELKAQHAALDDAIKTFERLVVGSDQPRRGRPAKWMLTAKSGEPSALVGGTGPQKRRGRPKGREKT